MHDEPALRRALQELREMGVQIALDDFGTGYSSLSYVRQFPLDKLKIDRSFVRSLQDDADPASTAIAKAVIDVATALDLETVAEGIDTPSQLHHLRALGATHAQGFLLAKPMGRDRAASVRRADRALLYPAGGARLTGLSG
jgi:EAL domain-containing protein (putative c-di-GMP-specific phosphodiesterase class I)